MEAGDLREQIAQDGIDVAASGETAGWGRICRGRGVREQVIQDVLVDAEGDRVHHVIKTRSHDVEHCEELIVTEDLLGINHLIGDSERIVGDGPGRDCIRASDRLDGSRRLATVRILKGLEI